MGKNNGTGWAGALPAGLIAASLGICAARGAELTPAATAPLAPVSVSVDPGSVVRTMRPEMLGSSNIAFWNQRYHFASPILRRWLAEMRPAMLRLPGGSYADHIYWNGYGVRRADGSVDPDAMGPDGYPAVDYSGYAPSFTADRKTRRPGQSAAQNVDVGEMHEFVKALPGVSPMVIANAGTGRAVDAAEWVRWANRKMGYHAVYWEVGNELDGDWEPGHILPDGTHLTGPMYAARFREFATAMKAVDPAIKIGGATTGVGADSFTKDMLRDAGELVDFVSIHTYPGTALLTDREAFDKIPEIVAKEVGQAKAWIREFQPARQDEIEIVYSEWNLGNVPATGTFCSDMFSAIWASIFLGEMARNGVTAATHWDCFTHGENGGFSLFHTLDNKGEDTSFLRKSQYYAFLLWNTRMGGRLLTADVSGDGTVRAYASRSEDEMFVLLLNTDRDREAPVEITVGDFPAAPVADIATLSSREYFWNTRARRPQWSTGPRTETIPAGPTTRLVLAPFSITSVRIPSAGSATPRKPVEAAAPALAPPELRFVMKEEIYAGDVLDGVLLALKAGTEEAYPVPLPAAALSASGPADLDRTHVRLTEAMGRFALRPGEPGPLTLTATVGEASASLTLNVKSSVPKPVVYWDFTDPPVTDADHFHSDWTLVEDQGMRPNRSVARIDLPEAGIVPTSKDNQRALLIVRKFPGADRLKRENIRGVFFDVMTSADFSCDDPNVGVTVVLQNPAVAYWMVLGTLPLPTAGKWEQLRIDVTNPKHIEAMDKSYNLWLVLSSAKPVKGSVYLDRIGLMVR